MPEKQSQLSFGNKIKQQIVDILHSGSSQNERPFLKKENESNIPGLYIVGDLAGAPVIKYAMAQGFEVIEHIATLPNAIGGSDKELHDVVIIGAGASGLNAALQAKARGMRYVLLRKSRSPTRLKIFPRANMFMPSRTRSRRKASSGSTARRKKI